MTLRPFAVSTLGLLLASFAPVALSGASPTPPGASLPPPADPAPSTFARFVPERADDFAWENDLIAFRTYGPALRAGTEDSGFDAWLKRVPYPILDRWYAGHLKGVSYHQDHGEGYDPYHVGASRGCGGLALWRDGRMVTSDTFIAWRILEQTRERTVFELDYTYPAEPGAAPLAETKRISIRLGEPFFEAASTFTRAGAPVADLPLVIGVSTQNGRARALLDPKSRWIGAWDKIDGHQLGTGAVLAPGFSGEARDERSPEKDRSHALLFTRTDSAGRIVYHVGYGWERAGRFLTVDDWTAALEARATAP